MIKRVSYGMIALAWPSCLLKSPINHTWLLEAPWKPNARFSIYSLRIRVDTAYRGNFTWGPRLLYSRIFFNCHPIRRIIAHGYSVLGSSRHGCICEVSAWIRHIKEVNIRNIVESNTACASKSGNGLEFV